MNYLVFLNDMLMKSLTSFNIGRSSHKYTQRTLTLVYFILNAFWFEAEVQSSRRRRDDILDVGESTLDVGELTVGETTVIRPDYMHWPKK